MQHIYEDSRLLKGLSKTKAPLVQGEPHWTERVPIALVALAGAAVGHFHPPFYVVAKYSFLVPGLP